VHLFTLTDLAKVNVFDGIVIGVSIFKEIEYSQAQIAFKPRADGCYGLREQNSPG